MNVPLAHSVSDAVVWDHIRDALYRVCAYVYARGWDRGGSDVRCVYRYLFPVRVCMCTDVFTESVFKMISWQSHHSQASHGF